MPTGGSLRSYEVYRDSLINAAADPNLPDTVRGLAHARAAGLQRTAQDPAILRGHAPQTDRMKFYTALAGEANDFMSESRCLDNTRLKQVLGFKLRYPTVHEGLAHALAVGVD